MNELQTNEEKKDGSTAKEMVKEMEKKRGLLIKVVHHCVPRYVAAERKKCCLVAFNNPQKTDVCHRRARNQLLLQSYVLEKPPSTEHCFGSTVFVVIVVVIVVKSAEDRE